MKVWKQILTWLGVMSVLTLVAMGLWYLLCGGDMSTASLKWLQLMQTVGTFLLPPLLCAWMWSATRQPWHWLQLDQRPNGKVAWLAVAIMVCAIPGINLLADLNGRVVLPESLGFIEHFLREQEDTAAALTRRFLEADHFGIILLNMGLLAVLPALAEELSFRGTLQQVLGNRHTAIWITAFVFSAIHMQFYGFVPRMLMGALFGYVFVWTGNLWIPMLMHFVNNSLAVLSFYLFDNGTDTNYADTIGAGTTWWLGVLSIMLSIGLILLLRQRAGQK